MVNYEGLGKLRWMVSCIVWVLNARVATSIDICGDERLLTLFDCEHVVNDEGLGWMMTQIWGACRQTDTWALNGFVRKKRRSLLETVEVARLDTVVDEDVLLLKIDTEGYEANVFAGAKNLLSRQKIQNILAEVKAASSPGTELLRHTEIIQTPFYWQIHPSFFPS